MSELASFIAPKGAEMLLESIRKGLFVPPLQDVDWCGDEQGQEICAAPKITTEDRRIQWQSWTADEIMLRSRILGPLFNIIPADVNTRLPGRRIIWSSGFEKSPVAIDLETFPGRPIMVNGLDSHPRFAIPTCDGQFLTARRAKLESHKDDDISTTAKRAKLFESFHKASQGLQ